MSNEPLEFAETSEGVHFYSGAYSYMEEGTLCGIGCDNPDIKDTKKTVVTCPGCIRILKLLRRVNFTESNQ